jgi:hypothetical protein
LPSCTDLSAGLWLAWMINLELAEVNDLFALSSLRMALEEMAVSTFGAPNHFQSDW